MAAKKPLKIGDTVPTRTFEAGDYVPAEHGGVPTGGTAGQVLAKVDATDHNTEWVDQTGGGGGGDYLPLAGNPGDPITGRVDINGNDGAVLEYEIMRIADANGGIFNIIGNDEGRVYLTVQDSSGDYYARLDLGPYSVGMTVSQSGSAVAEMFFDSSGIIINGIINLNGGIDMANPNYTLRPPRMSTTQRDALSASNGDVIYNQTTSKLQVYAGGSWQDCN